MTKRSIAPRAADTAAVTPAAPGPLAYMPAAPIVVDGKTISRLTVKALKLVDMHDAVKAAEADWLADKDSKFGKHVTRHRFAKQLVAHGPDGSAFSLTIPQIAMLPRPAGLWAMAAIDAAHAAGEAELIVEGDGIETPALIRLAVPLKQKTNSGDVVIEEIQIHAPTWGDAEEAANEDSKIGQTLALIRTCARPVCSDVSLIAMTDSLVKQISYEDGAFIMLRVLPRFL